jgi:hypothetical protein
MATLEEPVGIVVPVVIPLRVRAAKVEMDHERVGDAV